MAQVTMVSLNQIIEEGEFGMVATPAAAAYLNRLVRPAATFIYRASAGQINIWVTQHGPLLSLDEPEISHLDWLARGDRGRVTDWIIDRIIIGVLRAVVGAGSNRADYANLALTPWDIANGLMGKRALVELLEADLHDYVPDYALPVSVLINGNSFTHRMPMDLAMGILLFARTAHVDLGMTMYGDPLTYFMFGADDIYDIIPDHEAEHGLSLRMIDGTRRYYFFGTDFLRGIKTAAEWLGLDHHDYWNSLQDGRGTPLTF